jgi:transcriptional repressor NrdR
MRHPFGVSHRAGSRNKSANSSYSSRERNTIMVCVYCGNPTKVTNSRSAKSTNGVWRRRRCTVCGAVFTTEESVDITSSFRLENKAGNLEPFLRDKLYLSIYKSLGHRQTALQDATALTRTVIGKVIKTQQDQPGKITRAELIATTQEILRHFDTIAATHYAAYHPLPKT